MRKIIFVKCNLMPQSHRPAGAYRWIVFPVRSTPVSEYQPRSIVLGLAMSKTNTNYIYASPPWMNGMEQNRTDDEDRKLQCTGGTFPVDTKRWQTGWFFSDICSVCILSGAQHIWRVIPRLSSLYIYIYIHVCLSKTNLCGTFFPISYSCADKTHIEDDRLTD